MVVAAASLVLLGRDVLEEVLHLCLLGLLENYLSVQGSVSHS